jgi:predicted enzyme related to lactoylglutathione lyase
MSTTAAEQPPVTVLGLSMDAADPGAVAAFWAAALGRTVGAGGTEEFASVAVGGPDSGSFLMFHRVPESKQVKNRVHLDLSALDAEAETDRLTGLGARVLRPLAENGGRWVSMADPEGNEFDLVAG